MRRLLRLSLVVVAAVLVCVVAFLVFLQTRWGGHWLAGVAAGQAERYVNGEVSIGRIEGSLVTGATLYDVVLSRNGETVVAVDRVSAAYDLGGLLGGGDFVLEGITLDRPRIFLTRGSEGLAIAALFGGDGPREPGGPPRRLSISPVVIRDGHVVIGPEPAEAGGFRVPDELRDLQANLAVERGPDGLRLHVSHLSFVGSEPSFTLARMSGDIRYATGDLMFDDVDVQTPDSQFTLNGAIENVTAFGG